MLYPHLCESTLCAYAQHMARQLRPGDCLCLKGPLGAGKSTFARAIIRALCPEITHVPSPTFPLVVTYPYGEHEIWHCDFYRMTYVQEIEELGVLDAMPHAITLIEWPEKMGIYLPENRVEITLAMETDQHRSLHIAGYGKQTPERIAHLIPRTPHDA